MEMHALQLAASSILSHPSPSRSKGMAKLLFVSGHEVQNNVERVESLQVLHLPGKQRTAKDGEDRPPPAPRLSSSGSHCLCSRLAPLVLQIPITTIFFNPCFSSTLQSSVSVVTGEKAVSKLSPGNYLV